MNENRTEQNRALGRQRNMAALRAVVAAYLAYLGGSLLWDRLSGKSDMALWAVWVCGILFIAAGIGFGWYTWKRWQADKKKAEEENGEDQTES